MGLPLACQFAARGATVYACDVNPKLIAAINAGECPIDEPGVAELLSEAVDAGRLQATSDVVDAVRGSDCVVVIVPVLLTPDNHADLAIMTTVTRQIAKAMHPGLLVSYETTMPIGTTRQVLRPLLESGGLKAGKDFHLVYSPERVKSQLVMARLRSTPKVVGGVNNESAAKGAEFYATWLGAPVTNVHSLEAAELVKVAGMVYRDVNIALSNLLACYAEELGVELGPVIEAANTDGEASLLIPGIGVGGHCTPVYPYFLIHSAREHGVPITLAEDARNINDAQASRAIERIERAFGSLENRSALILGLGFRPQVKEHVCSPAFLLQKHLRDRGALVSLHDPLYSNDEHQMHGFQSRSLDSDPAPDIIILNTAHEHYQHLDFKLLASRGVKAVFDGRNLWNPDSVRGAGLIYLSIGRPDKLSLDSITVQA